MKKYFLTGLVILLPLVVTIMVITFLVNFLTQPFIGIVSSFLCRFHIINEGFLFLSSEQLIRYSSQLIAILLLFFVTLALGFITRSIFVHSIFKIGDRIIHKIPIIKTVYKTTQDIINTLFTSDKNSFKQVVLAPFPRDGIYVLGLVSRESPSECTRKAGDTLISVLIPTTPNPTTGYLLMYKRDDLIFLEMRPEEAIKYIVSCGVIIPEDRSIIPPKAT
ncbi:MAG: DUF502 domain-containing protein [Chlamydiota bacterium]